MIRRSVTSGALATVLLAGVVWAVPAPGLAAASPPEFLPTASLMAAPPTGKKQTRGVLRVKGKGTGSYTIRSKGFRKKGTTSKSYRLRPGVYTVKAPGARVKPKKKVRVRKGKKTVVRVVFPRKTPVPGPSPVQLPEPGPVDQVPTPAPTPTPGPKPPVDVTVTRQVSLPPGSAVTVELGPELESLTTLTGQDSDGPVSWSVSNGQLTLAVNAETPPGQRTASVTATGCTTAEDCGRSVSMSIGVQVQPLQANADSRVDELIDPSPDRVASGKDLTGGAARQLLDEATVVLGSADSPGNRQIADTVAASVGAVVVGGLEEHGIYQLRWNGVQDIEARVAQLRARSDVDGVDIGVLITDPAASTVSAVPPSEMGNAADHTWPLTQMRAQQAWSTTTGADVPVGIVDGWVVDDHRDLNVSWRNDRFGLPTSADTGEWHATHVAGLACARANEGDTVGVAWGCPLISSSGTYSPKTWNAGTSAQSMSSVIGAIDDVVSQGARVVNISLGWNPHKWLGYGACLTQQDADRMASAFGQGANNTTANQFYRIAVRSNAVFTLSAGNNCAPTGGSPFVGADSLDNVISVAAVNSNSHLAAFSNWDAEVAAGGGAATPDIGNDKGVWSTVPDDAYSQMTGTSMAAPLVAGVAALVRSANPALNARQAGRCVTLTAGTLTSTTRLRDNGLPAGYSPKIDYTAAIPIVDAATAVACGTNPPTHPKTGNDYIARNPSTGRAVLVTNGQRYAIPDGGTFNCLTKSLVVWDIPNLKALVTDPPGSVAGCVTSDQGDWTYTPTAQGGNIGTNIILRNPTGNAWLINSAGQIQTIEDGGTYLCLARTNPVIWNVPDDKINAWTPVGTTTPDCGPPPASVQQDTITAGGGHTCGVDFSRNAWCWGRGEYGQLGDGDTSGASEESPVAVAGGHTFAALTAGISHTCGVDTAGEAWCWGHGEYGQLGDTSWTTKYDPVAVAGGHTFATLTAGYAHTCGVDTAGNAWCWGQGEKGSGPLAVAGEHTFTTLTAGDFHTCGIDTAGDAWCWGYGEYGQLGDGDTSGSSKESPTAVAGGHTFTTLTAGYAHTCGIDTAGDAWCWGYGEYGQLGDGDTSRTNKYVPVAVTGGHRFTDLTAGGGHTCGVTTAGDALCWGHSEYGQLGDGDTDQTIALSPIAVTGSHTLAALTAGSAHTCGVTTASEAWCWGWNYYGQLGNGDTSQVNRYVPVAVAGGHTWARQ